MSSRKNIWLKSTLTLEALLEFKEIFVVSEEQRQAASLLVGGMQHTVAGMALLSSQDLINLESNNFEEVNSSIANHLRNLENATAERREKTLNYVKQLSKKAQASSQKLQDLLKEQNALRATANSVKFDIDDQIATIRKEANAKFAKINFQLSSIKWAALGVSFFLVLLLHQLIHEAKDYWPAFETAVLQIFLVFVVEKVVDYWIEFKRNQVYKSVLHREFESLKSNTFSIKPF